MTILLGTSCSANDYQIEFENCKLKVPNEFSFIQNSAYDAQYLRQDSNSVSIIQVSSDSLSFEERIGNELRVVDSFNDNSRSFWAYELIPLGSKLKVKGVTIKGELQSLEMLSLPRQELATLLKGCFSNDVISRLTKP